MAIEKRRNTYIQFFSWEQKKISNTFFKIAVYFVFSFGDTALKCAPARHFFTGIKILLAKNFR